MGDDRVFDEPLAEEDAGPVLARRRLKDTADLDITPMIDIVFLLLIFFLVASIPDIQIAADLPPARHGKGVNPRTAVIFTVAERGGPGPALVYLGDGKVGASLPESPLEQDEAIRRAVQGRGGTLLPDDQQTQKDAIRRAVEMGYTQEGKSAVVVKAERGVLHHEVARVAEAAGAARAKAVHLAVFEID